MPKIKVKSYDHLQEVLSTSCGTLDAPLFRQALEMAGIDIDIVAYDTDSRAISLDVLTVEQIHLLRQSLEAAGSESKTGRAFILEEAVADKPITIPTGRFAPKPTMFSHEHTRKSYGITPDKVEIGDLGISPGAAVLDVGAGDGTNAAQMLASGCRVSALEPVLEGGGKDEQRWLESCRKKLGDENVEGKTLQDAVRDDPDRYIGKFDILTAFKYNVPLDQKEEFIRYAANCLKPDGRLVITSVEQGRGNREKFGEGLYLVDALKERFEHVEVKHFEKATGGYDVISCSGPKPDPDFKPSTSSHRLSGQG